MSNPKGVVPIKHKKIYKALMNMVRWTDQIQKEYNIDNYSILSWAKEISTIKFGLPRRSGHSVFAIKLSREFNSPLIIVKNKKLKDSVEKLAYDKKIKNLTISTIDNIIGCSFCNDVVIIDNTFLFSKNDINNIYINTFSSKESRCWTTLASFRAEYQYQKFIFLQ